MQGRQGFGVDAGVDTGMDAVSWSSGRTRIKEESEKNVHLSQRVTCQLHVFDLML